MSEENHELNDEDRKFRNNLIKESLLQEREQFRKFIYETRISIDKFLSAVSLASIGVLITFFKDIIGDKTTSGWFILFFIVGIFCFLYSVYTSLLGLIEEVSIYEEQIEDILDEVDELQGINKKEEAYKRSGEIIEKDYHKSYWSIRNRHRRSLHSLIVGWFMIAIYVIFS